MNKSQLKLLSRILSKSSARIHTDKFYKIFFAPFQFLFIGTLKGVQWQAVRRRYLKSAYLLQRIARKSRR